MGKLDEISLAIGDLQASVRGLQGDIGNVERRMDDERAIRQREHSDNQTAFGGLRQDLARAIAELRGEIRTAINGNGAHPAAMTPPRIAALASIGVATIAALVWSLEAGIKWLVNWMLSHLH